MTEVERLAVEAQVVHALETCYDPEIPVNIYDLGLIYEHTVEADGTVKVKMTLTTPNCPAAAILPQQVEAKLKEIEGVTDAKVEVVWDPPWDANKMSDAAKLQLGLL